MGAEMSKADGGPAFPRGAGDRFNPVTGVDDADGMSLRQWYVGMVIQGMISSRMTGGKQEMAEWAFEWADALIAEGKK